MIPDDDQRLFHALVDRRSPHDLDLSRSRRARSNTSFGEDLTAEVGIRSKALEVDDYGLLLPLTLVTEGALFAEDGHLEFGTLVAAGAASWNGGTAIGFDVSAVESQLGNGDVEEVGDVFVGFGSMLLAAKHDGAKGSDVKWHGDFRLRLGTLGAASSLGRMILTAVEFLVTATEMNFGDGGRVKTFAVGVVVILDASVMGDHGPHGIAFQDARVSHGS